MSAVLTFVVSVLLSGVVAAIVAHRLASGRAAGERVQTTQSRLVALVGEIRDNIELAAKPIIGSGKVSLLTEQWSAAREHLTDAPSHIEEALRAAYVEVERYNSLAAQARTLPYGAGYMDKEVKQQAEQAKVKLEEALKVLPSK